MDLQRFFFLIFFKDWKCFQIHKLKTTRAFISNSFEDRSIWFDLMALLKVIQVQIYDLVPGLYKEHTRKTMLLRCIMFTCYVIVSDFIILG